MELAASPAARATFDKVLAEYTAWLRTRRVSRAEGAFPVALGELRLRERAPRPPRRGSPSRRA